MSRQNRPDLLATAGPPRAIPQVVGAKSGKRTRAEKARSAGKRLVSLDAYRGFIMLMLAANGFGIAALAKLNPDHAVWNTFSYEGLQRLEYHFTHPPWISLTGWMGVSFWDLIQPSFMFMVGVAMPLSYARRTVMGSSSRRRLVHAAWRAVVLILLGVFLASLRAEQTNWVFTNVLAQIGLGYLFAYLLLSVSVQSQLIAFAAILFGYWGWFMLNPPPVNFDYTAVKASRDDGEVFERRFAPWSKNANAAHFFDVWLLNKLRSPVPQPRLPADADAASSSDESTATDVPATASTESTGLLHRWFFSDPERFEFHAGGYTTLNFIPSIATMLLGILCGQLLIGSESSGRKLLTLVVMGAVCLALGILAHHSVCPIVKRIWTPSWVLFSGGYVIWMLAAFYAVFDMLPFQRLAFPLVVVGMNSIVMYLMGQMLRGWVADNIVRTHFSGVLQSMFGPDAVSTNGIGAVVLPTATLLVFWLVAFWMYRNRYFVRV